MPTLEGVVFYVRVYLDTTDGAYLIYRSSTDGVPHVDPAGFEKLDPPACR